MKNINIYIISLFIAFGVNPAFAQSIMLEENSTYDFRLQQLIYSSENSHPSIVPFYFDDILKENYGFTFVDYFSPLTYNAQHTIKTYLKLEPFIEFNNYENRFSASHNSVSMKSFTTYKNNYSLYFNVKSGFLKLPEYLQHYPDSFGIIPEYGIVAAEDNKKYSYVRPEFYFHSKLMPNFNAEAGMGTNFFGNGHRSLLLGNNHYPYPYLKFTTTLWKFQYVNIFGWLNDIYTPSVSKWSDGHTKFMSIHYLSWNVIKKLNVSFFEGVMAALYDTIMGRRFAEFNYLLPVVIYRPVEFSMGSPDNVLAGLNISYAPWANHIFYSQLAFGEFFMNEVKANLLHTFGLADSTLNHGAWVNKQAIQFGYRNFNPFGLKDVSFLSEFNVIRPYIYSHKDVKQNYSHLNQPITHPAGANLREFVLKLRYYPDRWFAEIGFNFIKTGLDSAGTHFGQDIFQSTFDAPVPGVGNIPVQYYGNKVAQGVPFNMSILNVRTAYQLSQKYNIWAEAGINLRKHALDEASKNYICFNIAIKWGLSSHDVDY